MYKFKKISINRHCTEHLYMQLYNSIKDLIINKDIKPHEKLPPIRKLADLLDVNNITVVKAYNLLENNNYVYKKIGSGTFVSDIEDNSYLKGFDGLEGEAYEDIRLMDRGQIEVRENVINFASATPTPHLFPVSDFKEVLNEVLDRDKGLAFGYHDSKGYSPLREYIVKYLEFYKINTSIESIQIISGAQQGIDIISKALLKHGDSVIVECPTYTGAIAAFESRGVKMLKAPITRDGIDLNILEDYIERYNPKLIYTMPNFQNPTGYSYSTNTKKGLLELASKKGLIIIEDDYLNDLNFYTDENITLKSMDKNENVIYIKSFSKIFMPGLRLGFLIVPINLNNEILIAKQTSDISTSSLIQRAFDLYLRKGIWKRHITYMKKIYKERFDTMVQSLENNLPEETTFLKPMGGINFWIGLAPGFSANELYSQSINKDIAFIPGGVFYPGNSESNFFRLSIADVYPDDIKKGIEILSEAIIKYYERSNIRPQRKSSYRPIL
ncbi:MocR-like pyridoxine biosynthesis transcription factor PdxR [Paramaledivibacter caminithermalis]|uniref:Transcriptional regulator, GntR family n=1 Tax=Paramaledivibacter caminithermalis (strain DSM 15212 / CIP 107654 / DViRD3) TaxID=1121301 RepID=A0A1M6Q583_PARC5|nr:PLP-dependent aminotransferase family protein [Paramaledivibacter caminithermalis]SHK15429.1 transcriptional regulator, GntR family [Paramaledivibacter caminithermalis DSM 15212]